MLSADLVDMWVMNDPPQAHVIFLPLVHEARLVLADAQPQDTQ